MQPAIFPPLFALGSFLGVLLMLEWGRRIGRRRLSEEGEAARTGMAAIEGSVYALTGLLIAFTFSGAAQRFDQRKLLVTEEANAIGTAWLRVDLMAPQAQPPLRAMFREYTDARIAAYRKLPDIAAARAELARSSKLQSGIWATTVQACAAEEARAACLLMVPALNAMFDITTTRLSAVLIHPPWVIYGILWLFVLVSALFSGQSMCATRRRDGLHYSVYALVMGAILYVIADIEFPRAGLIRVDDIDQLLVQLRASMG